MKSRPQHPLCVDPTLHPGGHYSSISMSILSAQMVVFLYTDQGHTKSGSGRVLPVQPDLPGCHEQSINLEN